MPSVLFAAIDIPIPEPQINTPHSALPEVISFVTSSAMQG
jgi:hypothetical protein